MTALLHRRGDGERVGGTTTVTMKATGADPGGSFHLGEVSAEPGFPDRPPHVHERQHDMFYVLEGTLTMLLGDKSTELAEGDFVCVPPGVVHTSSNPSAGRARCLNFHTPGGWENYIRELGVALGQGTPTPEQMDAIASRHDFRAA